jgi:putative transposase
MPRANRYITAGSIYHVTHRCHDREFLFKFARERNDYRSLLREHLHDSDVSLLAYCITSNHVHLLMNVGAKESLSALMQLVAGEFAQNFNRRKKRSGAFWGDRFHATLVDSDEYLLGCVDKLAD